MSVPICERCGREVGFIYATERLVDAMQARTGVCYGHDPYTPITDDPQSHARARVVIAESALHVIASEPLIDPNGRPHCLRCHQFSVTRTHHEFCPIGIAKDALLKMGPGR